MSLGQRCFFRTEPVKSGPVKSGSRLNGYRQHVCQFWVFALLLCPKLAECEELLLKGLPLPAVSRTESALEAVTSARGYSVDEFTNSLLLNSTESTLLLKSGSGHQQQSDFRSAEFLTSLGTVVFRTPKEISASDESRLRQVVAQAWEVAARTVSESGLQRTGIPFLTTETLRLTPAPICVPQALNSTPTYSHYSTQSPVSPVSPGSPGSPGESRQESWQLEPSDWSKIPWNIVVSRSSSGPLVRRNNLFNTSDRAYCHTAWIGPPADIVLDGYRLANPCDGSDWRSGVERLDLRAGQGSHATMGESKLLRTLVHEAAHAIEYRLMGRGFSRRQRWHSEGFAVWFENRAFGGSQLRDPEEQRQKSREAIAERWLPALFAGSPRDYLRSQILIESIVKHYGVSGLLRVYRAMDNNNNSFEEAVLSELGWDFSAWIEQARADLSPFDSTCSALNCAAFNLNALRCGV